MSALPTAKIEMAFGAGFSTAATSRTWTDVTAYVIGSAPQSITRGRTDELTQPQPSTMTLTLLNKDGRFTPAYTSGAYYPNIVKGVPVRESVTYDGGTTWSVRFTGYVAEWPVVWPDGSDVDSTVTITATSRLARLGQSAPLPSAIRAAYLATSPQAYWPMDEDASIVDPVTGQQVFRDITNPSLIVKNNQIIESFWDVPAHAPVVRDGTAGPTDEASPVKFPDTSDAVAYHEFVGGGNVMKVGTAVPTGSLTFQILARVTPHSAPSSSFPWGSIFAIRSNDGTQEINVFASNGSNNPQVSMQVLLWSNTGALLDNPANVYPGYPAIAYGQATDGNLHHYTLTMASTGYMALYFDGSLLAYSILDTGFAYNSPFTDLAIGNRTQYVDLWACHAMVHDRVLNATEILACAQAALATTESLPTRVTRITGEVGVPAAEVSAEASVAAPLGVQAELGRTATDVLNELAASTGGVLFDARDGTLTMQARNHRYNAVSAFTLGTSGQEIEADFTSTLDDRYLVNTVNVTRVGSQANPVPFTDPTSIAQYGTYSVSASIVSTSDDEAEAYGYEQLYRYAQPKVRVNQVTVDLVDLSTAQRALVLGAEIGTLFTLSGLPAQAPASSMALFIEGYTESISNASHTITFNTTPGSSNPAWILGDSTYGVLGSTTVLVY